MIEEMLMNLREILYNNERAGLPNIDYVVMSPDAEREIRMYRATYFPTHDRTVEGIKYLVDYSLKGIIWELVSKHSFHTLPGDAGTITYAHPSFIKAPEGSK